LGVASLCLVLKNLSKIPKITLFFYVAAAFALNQSALAQNAGKKSKPLPAKQAKNPLIKATSQQKVAKIEVRGNKRIEKEAILLKVKVKENEFYTAATVREDMDALYKTGFFNDIRVERDGDTLIYNVVEKPTIAEIVFEGNSEIKTDDLLENSGLKAFEIINMTKVKDSMDKLQKFYEDKGYFLARLNYKVSDVVKGESVKLTITVSENDKVKVQKITFLGNKRLKDGFLKARLATSEAGYFSFMSGSGGYKQEAFERDVQILKVLYLNEGYVQAKIERPEVYVTPDKKSIYITIKIDEGEQYDIGEIDFAGDLLFSRTELSDTIEINKRKTFSYETLQKDLSELQAKYGDLGYAFTNVIPRTRILEKERKIDITFEFDKGNKVYFGQINVVGNSKTRDKVVRRELKIAEGELYNETNKRESIDNVRRLGFFEEVNFKTSTPPDKPNQLDIEISLKERNTGQIQLGAGWGSNSGFSLQGSVSQTNFLGKGQSLSSNIRHGQGITEYGFDFTEPYFNDTEWSLGFGVSRTFVDQADYKENRTGGTFRFGHPLGEYIRGSVRYRLEQTNIDYIIRDDGTNYHVYTDETIFNKEKAQGLTSSIAGVLEYDKRNDRFSPSAGIYASGTMEYAGLGGKFNYTRGITSFKYFKKLFWEVVWRNNLNYQFIQSHNSDPVPFNELYKLGGAFTLRGYNFYTVGKRVYSRYYDASHNPAALPPPDDTVPKVPASEQITDPQRRALLSQRPYGGEKQLLYQMEFEFPLIAEAGIKGVAFYDLGQADDQITAEGFYSNVGFGFRWFSPIGPLRFEWGFPLRRTEFSPDANVFQFTIGTPF
jgi:outer membrane protein insertion porin family